MAAGMPGDVRFEEPWLTDYLVKQLRPLTEADPVILAEYVVALLKKDKPTKELQKLCADNLMEFLGPCSETFTTKLFQTLEDGSIVRSGENLDDIKQPEPSGSPNRMDGPQVKTSSLLEEEKFSTSESVSDPEDKEVSDDDDDDDRNHKHRRREARPQSPDEGAQEQTLRRYNRKRNKPYENGRPFVESDPQSSDFQKRYNPSLEKDLTSRFNSERSGWVPQMRAFVDLGPRARLSHGNRADPGARFDFSASSGRPPLSRGRGRSTVPWNQHDPRFNPLETLDFASQMMSHGHAQPNLFIGTGLSSSANSQSPSWSAFGLIPGMSSGILDPLHPLNLQGNLPPPITPPLNLGVARQRCRDFEERGFCLRGDMCPMEHGVNRIVVEDVQSLSQFNLPVSLPSSRPLGIQAGTGCLPAGNPSSGLLSSKALPNKSSKPGMTDNPLNISGVLSAPNGVEADVYDPDQPLWNSERPETSSALLRFPSPKLDAEPFLDGDSSVQHNRRFSENIESECPPRIFTSNLGSRSKTSSVRGRIGSVNNLEIASRIDNNVASTGCLGKETRDGNEKAIYSSMPANCREKNDTEGRETKETISQPTPRPGKDSGHNQGNASQKASRTLYVNGIPQSNNRKAALVSHFQKFGEVINIYIPLNSEKAFVQFSKREEAEAALKAPDAVMGNRFIKLWWANRDNIPDEGQTIGNTKSRKHVDVVVPSVPQPVVAPIVIQKGIKSPAGETSLLPTSQQKNIIANSPTASNSAQKKMESLEHLKDEIRRKQEMLAQKREEFRRQLARIEKQAVSDHKGESLDQAGKRQKMEKDTEVAKAAPHKATSFTLESSQVTDKAIGRSSTSEILVTSGPPSNSITLHQSSRNINQANCAPAKFTSKFKLDNRSTSFRILPPLPAGLTNVAALKEHFSSINDLTSVVIEDPEGCIPDAGLETSSNCSARVTFATRQSAERAFLSANCWQGQNLQFKWLAGSHNSSDELNTLGSTPNLTPRETLNVWVQHEPLTSKLPSSSTEACGNHCEAADVIAGESTMDVEGSNSLPGSMHQASLLDTKPCPVMPECGRRPSESNVLDVKEGVDVGFSQ